MNLVFFRYNPRVIDLDFIADSNVIIIAPESQSAKYEDYNLNVPVVFISDYTLAGSVRMIREKFINQKIQSISTLAEDDMDWVGLLSDFFTGNFSASLHGKLFKDKYVMRSFLQGIVEQPVFSGVFSEKDIDNFWTIFDGNKALIKPRNSAGAHGIKTIFRDEKISESYFTGDFLIEGFVQQEKMMTGDGYAINGKIQRYFSHNYETMILESLSCGDKEAVTRTNVLYGSKKGQLKIIQARSLSEKILKNFGVKGVTPFHFEWFYDDKSDILTFCEVALRFGGADIPRLIEDAFKVDLLSEYWSNQFTTRKTINTEIQSELQLPTVISSCYMPYRGNGKLVETPSQEEFSWTESTLIFVKPGDVLKEPNSVVENLFLTRFLSDNEENYYENLKRLRGLAERFRYEQTE